MFPLKSQPSTVDQQSNVTLIASDQPTAAKCPLSNRNRSGVHASTKICKENLRPEISTSPPVPVNPTARASFMRRLSNPTATARKRRSWHSGYSMDTSLRRQSGRFERDFVEVGTIGSGEFGSVI